MKPGLKAWARLAGDPAHPVLTEAWTSRQLREAGPTPDFTLLSVYRRANAPHLEAFARDLPNVRLWALDEPAENLADVTVGSGPGLRMELLNRLAESADTPYLVVSDDDMEFVTGSVSRLVAIAARHELDLCQPAQSPRGHWSHSITLRHHLSGLRMTNFVEVGPMVVIGPRLRDQIVPFPDDAGHGWGLDVRWSQLRETHAARLAIVDAVAIRHLNPVAADYSQDKEGSRLRAALNELNLDHMTSLPTTYGRVRPWAL